LEQDYILLKYLSFLQHTKIMTLPVTTATTKDSLNHEKNIEEGKRIFIEEIRKLDRVDDKTIFLHPIHYTCSCSADAPVYQFTLVAAVIKHDREPANRDSTVYGEYSGCYVKLAGYEGHLCVRDPQKPLKEQMEVWRMDPEFSFSDYDKSPETVRNIRDLADRLDVALRH
jgi:hypothetical protein